MRIQPYVTYAVAQAGFYKLIFDIGYDEQGGHVFNDQEVEVYRHRYQKILDELNNGWQTTHKAGS